MCADTGIQWTVSLAILRTCKLFYAECKDLLWHYNALDLSSDPSQVTRWNSKGLYDARVWQHLQKQVQMAILEVDIPSSRGPSAEVEDAMKELEDWAATGKLSHITLNLKNFAAQAWRWKRVGWTDDLSWKVSDHFFKAARDMYLNRCTRVLVVNLKVGEEGKREEYSQHLEVIKTMSQSFGGKLICDGRLCFENGTEVEE